MLKAIVSAFLLVAVAWPPGTSRAEALLDTPLYNPETKSYFELVWVPPGWSIRGAEFAEISWERARQFAHQQTYKGVRGRLALVKSEATHHFLRRFQPDRATWIGLRYWCHHGKLQLATGEFYPKTGYAGWDRNWAVAGTKQTGNRPPVCTGNFPYWPVHYWSIQEGFRWNANGTLKEWRYVFIEYPTGKE